jgi:hypothetical protein
MFFKKSLKNNKLMKAIKCEFYPFQKLVQKLLSRGKNKTKKCCESAVLLLLYSIYRRAKIWLCIWLFV